MALGNKRFVAVVLFSLMADNVSGKIVLPELLTKQSVANIRFLSQDGKFTYYQKYSGHLLFSSNYKVIEMLKGKPGAQYTLVGSSSRKKVAIMQNENFHSFYSLRGKEKIYLVNFGETALREVGTGVSARLHLDDTWLSFYDYYSKTITLENTTNAALKINLKLNNRINPYFLPQVLMTDTDTVYYTDLSETGTVGLVQFKRSSGKAELIFKASTPMVKADICIHNNALILGLFGINSSSEGSLITKTALPIVDFSKSKRETIYSSKINDFGQMVCDFNSETIIFIKNFGGNDYPITDLAELNVKTKETKTLSEFNDVSNIINMDGSLLTLNKGRYFIVKGTNDYKNIDSLKALPPESAVEAMKNIDHE